MIAKTRKARTDLSLDSSVLVIALYPLVNVSADRALSVKRQQLGSYRVYTLSSAIVRLLRWDNSGLGCNRL